MLFGEIVGGSVAPSDAGVMVESWWSDIPRRFPTVSLDAYVIMPNHLHGILVFGKDPAATIRRGGHTAFHEGRDTARRKRADTEVCPYGDEHRFVGTRLSMVQIGDDT